MAFPDFPTRDDFNRSDRLLASDGWWADDLSDNPLGITGQECYIPGAGPAWVGTVWWYAKAATHDQQVQFEITNVTTVAVTCELLLGFDARSRGMGNGYTLIVQYLPGPPATYQWTIGRRTPGVFMLLAEVNQMISNNDWIGFGRQGSALTAYIDQGGGWGIVLNTTDDIHTGPGYVGFTLGNYNTIDNFGGGPIFAPAGSIVAGAGPVVALEGLALSPDAAVAVAGGVDPAVLFGAAALAPDPAAMVAATALGGVGAIARRITMMVVGTADGAAPHQVLNLREEDQQPAVLFVWRDEDGEGLDFSAATVHFRMRARMAAAGVFKVDTECIKLGDGQVVWTPVAGDLDTPGEYWAYLVADYGGDVYRTSEMIVVRVWEGL